MTKALLRLVRRARPDGAGPLRARARVRMRLEEMEARILHSADLVPGAFADAIGAQVQMRLVDAAPESAPRPAATEQTQRRELVIVDTATPDYQALVDDIAAHQGPGRAIEVVLIDSGRDGIAQVTETLASRSGLDAVHLISHGADGALRLGSSVIDSRSVETRSVEIAAWSRAFAAGADLLIYGCDVAATSEGRMLVDALAGLTGADVAASIDATGHALMGGDWVLEYETGAIEAHLALSQAAQAEWFALLATERIQASQDTYILSNDTNNYGGSTQLIVDKSGGGVGDGRALLKFDLSGIPSGATIQRATLQLDATAVGATMAIGVYELLAGWTEGNGAGSAGVANWNQSSAGTNWSSAGGTMNSTPAATTSAFAGVTGLHTWDVTSLVRSWADGTKTNNGVLVGSGDTGTGAVTFSSREGAAAPTLRVEYTAGASTAAPALAGANALTGTAEDASSNAGTLVSALIAGHFTDADAGAAQGIAVTDVVNTNGAWQYSVSGGAWTNFGTPGQASARLLAADATTAVRFVPNANWNGIVTNGISFRAWDQSSGVAGGTADTTSVSEFVRDRFDTDKYDGTNGNASWSGNWTEVADIGAHSNGQIQAVGGRLFFNGGINDDGSVERGVNLAGATSANLSFTVDNTIGTGTMKLWASANGGSSWSLLDDSFPASGSVSYNLLPYASANTRIRFEVIGTAGVFGVVLAGGNFYADDVRIDYVAALNGGITAFSTAIESAGVSVAAVNDAPQGASKTVTMLEDAAFTFGTPDFGFSDAIEGNALAAVRIATVPAAGTLALNGTAVTAGQSVSAADIAAGKLVFTPVANANGAGYASFTFQVQDDGGTANGGVDLDPTARTMTVNVTSVNDVPQGASKTVTTSEDAPFTFGAADFGFTDAADGNALAAVRIATVPAVGTLALNGTAVIAGQSVSAADIAAGRLVFTPVANANGAGYASFTFQVQDDGGTANGGADLDPTARTMTVNVTSVNDAPQGASKTVTTNEDAAFTFGTADFGFTDAIEGNALAGVRIATLPGAGALAVNGTAVTAGQIVSEADIAAGKLVFTPAANANGAGHASFTFRVQDDGGTANGGVDLDVTARTMTVNVTSVNDAPQGASKTVTVLEDAAFTFGAADFGFTDAADGNALTAVRIATVPAAGTLALNGTAVIAGQSVSAADIAAGRLVFTPVANANGTGYASFTFQVQDDGGTANGGVDLDATARTMTVNVTSVNDVPQGASKTVTTNEDAPFTFGAADFGFTDAIDGNVLAAVRIATVPAAGTLALNGTAVTAGQSVSAADIAAGRLVFTPAANANGTGYGSFTFQVQDDGGTANGGVNLDATARTMTVNVTSVNDAPQGASKTVTMLEDAAFTFGTADFGFADAADGNALTAVRIATVPAAGTLALNGTAVTAGQSVSAADIAAGRLVFTPVANANGTGYASFTFQVQDDGGTANGGVDLDATARTMTVNVTSVNDVPLGASKTVTTNEDAPFTFGAADFGFTDAIDGNVLAAVRIATVPAAGALALNGTAVTAGQSVSAADIAAGRLVFTPAANANGAGYAIFTFQVQDDGGTANGGVNLDPTARTMTVNVTSVNDAPVLTGANNLATINEDAAGNGGTLVSALIAGRASDADAGALSGIAVTGVDNTNGAWQYSTDGGGAWSAFGTPSAGTARLLAADANTYVRFVPNANWNGTVTNGLTFRAWDQTLGANGGVAPTIPNPVFQDNFNTVSYSNNDGTARWSSAWVDTDGDASEGDIHVRSSTLHIHADASLRSIYREADLTGATGATLSFDYENDVDSGGSILLQMSGNGGASYTTIALFSGGVNTGTGTFSGDVSAFISATTRIRFLVLSDSGDRLDVDNLRLALTAPGNGGASAFSAATAASAITVTPVNDAPRGASNTVVGTEDTTGAFTAAMFGFSDAGDSPADAFAAVKITTLPTAGALTLEGAPVAAGQLVSVADINAGKLAFRADPDANGTGYASFTFQVQDAGGTANGGVDLDPVARTMTINVTAVSDAPVLSGANNLPAINEDVTTSSGILVSGLIAGYVTDADAGALAGIAVTAVDNSNGTWQYSLNGTSWSNFGSPGVASARLLNADADNRVRFVPDANWNGTSGLTFRAWDRTSGFSGSTANTTSNGGATAFSTASATAGITVNPVNDAPAGASATVTTAEDTPFVFGTASFGLIDAVEGHSLLAVKVETLPAAGALTVSGAAVTAGQFVSAVDIAAGNLVYTPAANTYATGYAAFTFRVQDAGGTANGGVDLDPVTRTMTVNVTAVNDAPRGASATLSLNEDTPYTFSAASFGFGDPSDTPANAFLAVRIVTPPAAGALLLNGVAVAAGEYVGLADIAAGKLTYAPAANAHGAAYASLAFQVQDAGGTENGGVDLDPVARTLTFDVASVNDAPAGASTTLVMDEDTALTLTAAHFGFSDAGDAPANALSAVKISSLPTAGALRLNGIDVAAGQLVSAADIGAGRLVFSPAANANGTGYAAFTFQVQDDGGTANGGRDLDPVARTLTVDVASVNDAPEGADITIGVRENEGFVFTAGVFGFSDASDTPANNLLGVRIESVPVAGALTLRGAAVSAGQFVSTADIATGDLVYTPVAGASGTSYAGFTFRVRDDGGGADTDALARSLTIDVGAINHAPRGVSTTVTLLEDGAHVFARGDFGFGDPADSDAHGLLAVKISSLPLAGALTLNGAAVVAGQAIAAADIDAGRLVFTPPANAVGAPYASFTFRVQDDGGTANGGTDTDTVARTMRLAVTAVNDGAAGASRTLATNEDTPLTLSAADFGFSDALDGDELLAVRITAVPAAGALTLNGVAVTAGQFVAAADIAAGGLVYTPAANGHGAGYARFAFQVQDDGGTANGGTDIDPVARILTIDVASVNDAPSGTSRTIATNEDTPLVFATADFGFSDAADAPANGFASIRIGTLPLAGALTLNGAAVTVGQSIAAADIASGRLVYTPVADAHGAGYASFTFQVRDDGGGTDLDPIARTLTIDVAAVNDAPTGADRTIAMTEDGAYAFAAADFGFSDTGDTPANAFAAVRIATLPGAGALTLGGTAVAAGQTVGIADIDAGRLVYTPRAGQSGAGYAAFTFRVQDDGGGSSLDAIARTMRFDVAGINHAPVGRDNAAGVLKDANYVFGAGAFGFSDPGDTPANAFAGVKITTLPGLGLLAVNGVAVGAGQFVSRADIDAGALVYTGSSLGSHAFTFQVQDDAGGADLDTTARTFTFNVSLPVIVAPIVQPTIVEAPAPIVAETPVVASAPPAASTPASSTSSTSSTTAASSSTPPAAATAPAATGGEQRAEAAGEAGGQSGRAAIDAPLPGALPVDEARGPVGATSSSASSVQVAAGVPKPDTAVLIKDVRDVAVVVQGESQSLLGQAQGGDGFGGGSLLLATQAQSSSAGAAYLNTPESRALGQELDQLRENLRDQSSLEAATVAATAATGMSLSVGYVVWLLRGGALLSTVLSSLPAWRFIDPLPVLGRVDEDDMDGDDDSLESMVAAGDAPSDPANPAEPSETEAIPA